MKCKSIRELRKKKQYVFEVQAKCEWNIGDWYVREIYVLHKHLFPLSSTLPLRLEKSLSSGLSQLCFVLAWLLIFRDIVCHIELFDICWFHASNIDFHYLLEMEFYDLNGTNISNNNMDNKGNKKKDHLPIR